MNNNINQGLKSNRYSNDSDTVCVEIENNHVVKQEDHGSLQNIKRCFSISTGNDINYKPMPDPKRIKYDPSIALNLNQNFLPINFEIPSLVFTNSTKKSGRNIHTINGWDKTAHTNSDVLELLRQTGKSQFAKIRTTPGTKNVKLPVVITEKQFSPVKRNTAVKQSRNSGHKEQMSEIEKYSDTCADTEGKYLHDSSRKCLRSSKFLSNQTNNLRDSLGKENCNESVLNNVVEKLKPALSYNTCGNRNGNNCTHSVGKSSNTSKLSRNVNESMFSCEDIEGVDKRKCHLSTEMTSSSDLSYTSDQINKSAETPKSISTRNKIVNSQSCVNKTTDQNSNNHSKTPQRQNKTPKKQDRSLMNSKVDGKYQNVLKSVGTGIQTSISDHKENLVETQNLLGQKVLGEPVYYHPRQLNHQKRLRNKLLQKQIKSNEPN